MSKVVIMFPVETWRQNSGLTETDKNILFFKRKRLTFIQLIEYSLLHHFKTSNLYINYSLSMGGIVVWL